MNNIHHDEWYETWFNSPYYHILYESRNDIEAARFVKKIVHRLHIPPQSRVLDLACGRGRFAHQLSLHQLEVVGIDIAGQNIQEAQRMYEGHSLHFIQHDMLRPFPEQQFDYVFNFFTSFGYFDTTNILLVLKHIYAALNPHAFLFIDYLNIHKAIHNLVPFEQLQKQHYTFDIERKVENQFIIKRIQVSNNVTHECFHFSEAVYKLSLEKFVTFFNESGFVLEQSFGDYQLSPYDEKTSDRLIVVAKKV